MKNKKVIIVISVLILVIMTFALSYFHTKKLNYEKNEKWFIKENKISKSFFAKTKLTKNFTKYKGGFGDDLKDISLNKLKIVDDRTLLDGMVLFSEENLENTKIKILSCDEMPLEPKGYILGDCFEINPGTNYKFSKYDYLIFPKKIFKDIDDVNFGYSEDEGGVYLNHFNNEPCKDCGDGEFYTGDYIDNDKRYFSILNPNAKKNNINKFYFNDNSYFNGYYYISYKDRKKRLKEIKDKFGIKIKEWYFKKDGKVFVKDDENKILLRNVSPDDFDVFYIGNKSYIKDKNAIFLLEYKYRESCGHHACTLKNINTIKIKDIKNKTFSIYDKEKQLVKIDNDFYILNDRSLYKVDINNPRFNELLKLDYILSKNKIIYLQHNKELEGVDIKTFKFIGGNYFADKNNIYIYGRKQKLKFKFDYNSLWATESGLLKDKNGVYLLEWVNADTFVQKNDLISDSASFKKIVCKNRGCYFNVRPPGWVKSLAFQAKT